MGLAGDDLPLVVAAQPGVGDVITRFHVLTEDGFGFVGAVTQNGGVANDPADDVVDLNRAGISRWQRSDVGHEFLFIERAPFLVGESAIVGEIFFSRRLVSRNNRVVEFLGAPDEFVLSNRRIGGERGHHQVEITK